MSKMPQMPGNMQDLMRQAQKMQKEVTAAQDEITNKDFVGNSASDYVKVTMNGDHEMKDIEIAKDVIDPDDPEMLQDLIISAVNDAEGKIKKETQDKLGKYTQGM